MLKQLQQVSKMGGLGGVLAKLPGVGKRKQMASAGVDDKSITDKLPLYNR